MPLDLMGMPPTGTGMCAAGSNLKLTTSAIACANLAKTWLTLAGDLDDLDEQLKL